MKTHRVLDLVRGGKSEQNVADKILENITRSSHKEHLKFFKYGIALGLMYKAIKIPNERVFEMHPEIADYYEQLLSDYLSE
jgi:hypothetical protein